MGSGVDAAGRRAMARCPQTVVPAAMPQSHEMGPHLGGRRPRQARAHPVLHCLYRANSRQPTSRRQRWCRRAARCLGSGSASGVARWAAPRRPRPSRPHSKPQPQPQRQHKLHSSLQLLSKRQLLNSSNHSNSNPNSSSSSHHSNSNLCLCCRPRQNHSLPHHRHCPVATQHPASVASTKT